MTTPLDNVALALAAMIGATLFIAPYFATGSALAQAAPADVRDLDCEDIRIMGEQFAQAYYDGMPLFLLIAGIEGAEPGPNVTEAGFAWSQELMRAVAVAAYGLPAHTDPAEQRAAVLSMGERAVSICERKQAAAR